MLPKKEWKLLLRFYQSSNPDGIINFTAEDFKNMDETEIEARNRLAERGFIVYADKKTNLSCQNILEINDLPYLRITVNGKDTALLYNNWLNRCWLWLESRPLILSAISFLMGIVATITTQFICKHLGLN